MGLTFTETCVRIMPGQELDATMRAALVQGLSVQKTTKPDGGALVQGL